MGDAQCCVVCAKGFIVKTFNEMLLCDGCDEGYHMLCLEPPLGTVPEGEWYCDTCWRLKKPEVENISYSSDDILNEFDFDDAFNLTENLIPSDQTDVPTNFSEQIADVPTNFSEQTPTDYTNSDSLCTNDIPITLLTSISNLSEEMEQNARTQAKEKLRDIFLNLLEKFKHEFELL